MENANYTNLINCTVSKDAAGGEKLINKFRMYNYDVSVIKQKLFDRIEDASMLTQAHRMWLLNTIESVTTMVLIRSFITNTRCQEKFVEMRELHVDDVVDYIFYNHIEM